MLFEVNLSWKTEGADSRESLLVTGHFALNLFRIEGQKAPSLTIFFLATSINVEISLQNFLTFSFNLFVTPV